MLAVTAAQIIGVPQDSFLGYVLLSSFIIHKELNQMLLNWRFRAQPWFNSQLLHSFIYKIIKKPNMNTTQTETTQKYLTTLLNKLFVLTAYWLLRGSALCTNHPDWANISLSVQSPEVKVKKAAQSDIGGFIHGLLLGEGHSLICPLRPASHSSTNVQWIIWKSRLLPIEVDS